MSKHHPRHGIINSRDQEYADMQKMGWQIDSSAVLTCNRTGEYQLAGNLTLNPWRSNKAPDPNKIEFPVNVTKILGNLEINCKNKEQYLSLKNNSVFKNLTLGGEYKINAPLDFFDEITFMKNFVGKLIIDPSFPKFWSFKGIENLISTKNINDKREIQEIYIHSYIFSDLNKVLGKVKRDPNFIHGWRSYSPGQEHLEKDWLLNIVKENADINAALEHYNYIIKLGDAAGARNLAKLFSKAGKNIFSKIESSTKKQEKFRKSISKLDDIGIDVF